MFRICISKNNTTDGFNITGDNCQVRDSSAINNTSAGFCGTGATNLTVCNNIANINTGGDYVDVTDSNLCSSISAVQTSIDQDFEGTFTAIAAINLNCDLTGVYTAIATVQNTIEQDFDGTFTAIASLQTSIDNLLLFL